jgi:hypothetical protein
MQYSKFVVNEWPWCVWEEDLPNRNLELINSLDPTYFKYLANVHRQSFETGEHQQHAALALRTSYAHGLETFFAILFATIQAPDCVIGWLQKYDAKDLRQLIEKVQQGKPIRSKLRSQPHSWHAVAHMVLPPIAFQDTREQEDKIKEQFAASWVRFAQDFLEEKSTQEYNSIKHGFRISNGGFSLSIGKADTWGIPAPPERMQVLGGSEYGSSFFTAERIVDPKNAENITPHSKHHFRVRRYSRNWSPEIFFYGLHLLAISMENILSLLKLLHGVDPKIVQFVWPSDEALFDAPWNPGADVISINLDTVITPADIIQFSKEEILAAYPEDERPHMPEQTLKFDV